MPEKILFANVLETAKNIFANIIAQYRIIFKITLVTTLLGVGYGLLIKPSYKAVATFILEEKSGSKSGLGALASSVGFDIGSLTGGNANLFDGDNILDIMQSRLIVEKVLLSKLDTNEANKNKSLADLYIESNGINKSWNSTPEFANLNFNNLSAAEKHSALQDSILNTLVQKIVKNNLVVSRQNKKGSIITIQVVSRSQVFSKIFAERILKETSDLYIDIKTGNISNNINKLQVKADSLQRSLYNKSYEVSNLLNANNGIKTYTVPEELNQKDKTLIYTIFVEVTKNLETLKLSLINQTPVIQVLDAPKYPLINQNLPLILFALIGMGAGLVISFLVAIYIYTDKIK
ncbi:MAG: hypothetical protein D4R91_06540 [Sediminibacterium sp.]|jgi:hypothetical protein|nr:MAG: hypothetical protein D4R91_06540 [Sediminibacterium sp.]